MNRKSMIFQSNTFLYYAYGGNMLTFRIQMHNPTAEFVTIARLDTYLFLKNYRIEFFKYSSFWGGPIGTLVPTANAHVWGVVWRLHTDDMIALDEEKGVEEKKYYVKYVKVLTPHLGEFTCRTYIQKINPLPRGDNDPVPVERWPSWTYREVLILGSKEHGIPQYYIKYLKSLKHNHEEGALRTVCLLLRYANNQKCDCLVPGRIPRDPLKLDLNMKRYAPKKDSFLYFAYGSNMYKKRLLIKVTTAEFVGIGRLDHHQVDFVTVAEVWRGALSTIVPRDYEYVWGVIWRINNADKPVQTFNAKFYPRRVTVLTPEGLKVECITYVQAVKPIRIEKGARVPKDRRPSSTYLECMIKGAEEANLPPYYIRELKDILTNGKDASPPMMIILQS